jgi:hypothetical protein
MIWKPAIELKITDTFHTKCRTFNSDKSVWFGKINKKKEKKKTSQNSLVVVHYSKSMYMYLS